MKIAIASDHGGFEAKQFIISFLNDLGHQVEDFGCKDIESCDYPDYGIPATKSVAEGKNDRGILICTNGIGMCMLANKIPGILAALVYNNRTAEMTRRHHGSNILCLGGKEFSIDNLKNFVHIWLSTEFEGGRHERRIKKILALK